ncbi:hypothetical protein KUTeg_015586, partial [Tegillarca granosa]
MARKPYYIDNLKKEGFRHRKESTTGPLSILNVCIQNQTRNVHRELYHCPNIAHNEKDDDLDVDKGIFSKETMDLLIPHLESFPQDFLSQPFLSQNPELPDSIFSTDTTEQASTSSKSNDPTKLLSKYIDDQVIPPLSSSNYKKSKVNKPPTSNQNTAYNTIADDHKYGQTPLDQMPVVPDLDNIGPAPGPKPGPILLQHLQGNIDLSSMRSKQYYPLSSVSSKKPGSLCEQTTLSTSLSSSHNSNSNSSTNQNSVSQTATSSSTNQNTISHYLHPPSHSVQTVGRRYWLGGTDMVEEGKWRWFTSKKEFKFTAWMNGTENNEFSRAFGRTSEDCLNLDPNKDEVLTWNDENCQDPFYFICEKSAD